MSSGAPAAALHSWASSACSCPPAPAASASGAESADRSSTIVPPAPETVPRRSTAASQPGWSAQVSSTPSALCWDWACRRGELKKGSGTKGLQEGEVENGSGSVQTTHPRACSTASFYIERGVSSQIRRGPHRGHSRLPDLRVQLEGLGAYCGCEHAAG